MCDSPACRFCGNENETVKHIIFHCSRLSEAQRKLQKACKTQGVDFSLQNLFTKPKLQRNVEEFLYEIFKRKLLTNLIYLVIFLFDLLDTRPLES